MQIHTKRRGEVSLVHTALAHTKPYNGHPQKNSITSAKLL
jgi:hypothetical protein